MTDDSLLTTEEVADRLKVDLRTVYRMVKRGELKAQRVGRQWRFLRADIDRYLHEHRSDLRADRRRRVLVVEDEEPVRALMMRVLTQANYLVDTAADGQVGLACIRDVDYDLVITDLHMPGVGGLPMIREARRQKPLWELPILIVTGRSTEAYAIEAINLGVSGYLTKPFNMRTVLEAAARAMGDPPAPTA